MHINYTPHYVQHSCVKELLRISMRLKYRKVCGYIYILCKCGSVANTLGTGTFTDQDIGTNARRVHYLCIHPPFIDRKTCVCTGKRKVVNGIISLIYGSQVTPCGVVDAGQIGWGNGLKPVEPQSITWINVKLSRNETLWAFIEF